MKKIAINGFGRIGRAVFKIAMENPKVEVVAINDLGDVENLAYLLRHDSAYGNYDKEVKIEEGKIVVGGKEIPFFCQKDPKELPWGELGVDVVAECTGVFEDREGASGHLAAGAKKVIISAPTKDKSVKTIVLGCNEKEIEGEDVISMGSCTTNCIAPMMKVLDEKFGIEKSLMTTVHSYTATQLLVDSPAKKDFRRGRAAAQNIIPSTTGAAIAATKVLPGLEGKFDGMALRVPTIVGSISDVVAILKKEASEEEIKNAFKEAAEGSLKGILLASEDDLVSSDIVGDSHSCIVDLPFTKVVGNLVKVIGWYDNEWGYSTRMVELAEKI